MPLKRSHAVVAPLLVRAEDHLGVGLRAEAVPARLELAAQLAVVVDLAVVHEPQRAVVARERLHRRVAQVDDREPAEAERDALVVERAVAVGAAVVERARPSCSRPSRSPADGRARRSRTARTSAPIVETSLRSPACSWRAHASSSPAAPGSSARTSSTRSSRPRRRGRRPRHRVREREPRRRARQRPRARRSRATSRDPAAVARRARGRRRRLPHGRAAARRRASRTRASASTSTSAARSTCSRPRATPASRRSSSPRPPRSTATPTRRWTSRTRSTRARCTARARSPASTSCARSTTRTASTTSPCAT